MNLKEESRKKWENEIEPLLVQGEFMKVLDIENCDLSGSPSSSIYHKEL